VRGKVCENVLAEGEVVMEDVVSVLEVMCGTRSQDQDGWQSGVDAKSHYGRGSSGRVPVQMGSAVANPPRQAAGVMF
jgi:hypothetical protein